MGKLNIELNQINATGSAAFGGSTTEGERAFAEGSYTQVQESGWSSSTGAHTEGVATIAGGKGAHAEGEETAVGIFGVTVKTAELITESPTLEYNVAFTVNA
jgi:hypothetical protein